MIRYRDGVIKEMGELRLARGWRRDMLKLALIEDTKLLKEMLHHRRRGAKIHPEEVIKQIAAIRAMRKVLNEP